MPGSSSFLGRLLSRLRLAFPRETLAIPKSQKVLGTYACDPLSVLRVDSNTRSAVAKSHWEQGAGKSGSARSSARGTTAIKLDSAMEIAAEGADNADEQRVGLPSRNILRHTR